MKKGKQKLRKEKLRKEKEIKIEKDTKKKFEVTTVLYVVLTYCFVLIARL